MWISLLLFFLSVSSLYLPRKHTSSTFVCSLRLPSLLSNKPALHITSLCLVSFLPLINVINWGTGTACQPVISFVFLVGAVTRIPPQREAARNRYSPLIARLNSPSISWWRIMTVMNGASLTPHFLSLTYAHTHTHTQTVINSNRSIPAD